MKSKKSQSPPSGCYSVNTLSKITGHDRRTIDKAVFGVEPVKTIGRVKFYRLADVEKGMSAKPGKNLKDEKLGEEIRKLRIRNDRDEGKTVFKTEMAAAIRSALSQVAQISEAKLVNEWPNAVAGLDVPQARVYGKRLHDTLMAEYQKLAAAFPE